MMAWALTAREAAARIRTGALTSVELVRACLERIEHTDSEIGAWAYLDADKAIAQAEAMDDLRRRGRPLGALHGIPVGIKDIFDTKDMPTGLGAPVHKDRQPENDAALIERLRSAGAVILGKTVTTPFAFASPAHTRNPHDRARTPGGSSSGSAAAVAAGHVPLALGTQTGGSTIRPASFCGIHGYKPTRGVFSRRGCLETSPTLDQPGIFARTMDDMALLGDALSGYDSADAASYNRPMPKLETGYTSSAPVDPLFAWFDLPYSDRLSPAMREGLAELLEELGDRVEHVATPESFADVIEHHAIVHRYEFHRALADDPGLAPSQTDDTMKALLEHGARITDDEYARAKAYIAGAEEFFATFFNDYDAIIAPSALGEAPPLEDGTGDSICSTIWTFAGLPCLSLPWLAGQGGLPMGVQLIGSAEEDDRLFRTTAWLERRMDPDDEEDDS
jgi:Asp-tRNA(Asn)/Glu-tRNA(Gln) amidotransferase A subunit family amidase